MKSMPGLTDKSRDELLAANQIQAQRIADLEAKIAWFEEQFRLAKHQQFGTSSEKSVPEQPNLFNEAEAIADATIAGQVELEKVSYTRKKAKGQRELQLADLPVEEIEHRLPEEEQICPECQGALHEMGSDISHKLEMIPAKVVVHKHIRFKYACRHCQKEEVSTPILSAAMPAPAFPNSLASPSAVAHVMTQKFVMGIPLYRQEQQWERMDFELSRQTMANWMIKGAAWLTPLYDRLHCLLINRDIVHADETTLQVLKEEGRSAQTDSYMWLYRTGREGPPIVLYDYQTTRAGAHPKAFLEGFEGYLNADGFSGYDVLPGKIVLAGCWSHARRKFDEAIKVLPVSARKSGTTLAHAGLNFVSALFAIEADLKDATPQERYEARLLRSKPVLDRFKQWLGEQSAAVLPKGALGTAVNYCLNQWAKLTRFLEDGRLEIDNNRAERSIKPFVIGRKNWLFANTPKGANASATIYSIVETAKENGLDPFAYLAYLFKVLPNESIVDQSVLDQFLPWSEHLPIRRKDHTA